MTRRDLILLFLLGLAVPFAIAQFQSLPGYMDADYYFGGGIQLATGKGFTEPYLWNYLSDPQSLPAPSHAYWFPLASILAAAGMGLTGHITFAAARVSFILLAALIPPATASLAFHITSNRTPSLLSGLLACFPIYYAPFLPVTDNYAIFMVVGILFFYLLSRLSSLTAESRKPSTAYWHFFLLGLLSALFSLARSDGLLWLGISLLMTLWYANRLVSFQTSFPRFILYVLRFSFFALFGFLLLMSPWYARNLSVFGTLMAPGGNRALWLTEYNDTFRYPASQLTMQTWLASGWNSILLARLGALKLNVLNTFAAQGGIFLFPFIIVGLWKMRTDLRVRIVLLAWALLFLVMTFIFPFAGARGAFFHSGAALQPMWWILAPIGLDAVVSVVRQRSWFDDRASSIFRAALVAIAALMTFVVFSIRVLPGWETEDGHYAAVESLLLQTGGQPDAVIIVRNPPGYNVVTGRPAIALPAGGIPALFAVADRFHARYLVLEPEGTSEELRDLYDHPYQFPKFIYLGESDGNRLYEIVR